MQNLTKIQIINTPHVQYNKVLCSLCNTILNSSYTSCKCPNIVSMNTDTEHILIYKGIHRNKMWHIGPDNMPTSSFHKSNITPVDLSKEFVNLTGADINLMNYANIHYATIKTSYDDFKIHEVKNWTWGMSYEVDMKCEFPIPVVNIKDENESTLECVPIGLKKDDKIIALSNIAKILSNMGYTNVYALDNSERSVVIENDTQKILGYKNLLRYL